MIWGEKNMDFYEKLPLEFLIRFYDEIKYNIEKGILTKKMHSELGVIISVADKRGLSLAFPVDCYEGKTVKFNSIEHS